MTTPAVLFRVDVFSDDHGHWMEFAVWLGQSDAHTQKALAREQGWSRVRVRRHAESAA